MRRKDGTVKILDFGIAKLVEDSASELSTLSIARHKPHGTRRSSGTIGYISPNRRAALQSMNEPTCGALVLCCTKFSPDGGRFPAPQMRTRSYRFSSELPPRSLPANRDLAHFAKLQQIVSKALSKDVDGDINLQRTCLLIW
jgi:serine/threonine protein kinase